jgi:hypothetical protein
MAPARSGAPRSRHQRETRMTRWACCLGASWRKARYRESISSSFPVSLWRRSMISSVSHGQYARREQHSTCRIEGRQGTEHRTMSGLPARRTVSAGSRHVLLETVLTASTPSVPRPAVPRSLPLPLAGCALVVVSSSRIVVTRSAVVRLQSRGWRRLLVPSDSPARAARL